MSATEETRPATPVDACVAFLRQSADAAGREIETNPYWEGTSFYQGIDNACGGDAGRLAALFSPEAAHLLALLLEELQRQQNMPPCDKPDGCCNGCERRDDFALADVLARLLNAARPQEVTVRG